VKLVSIAISKKKGIPKEPVEEAVLVQGHGIEGDAHGGPWHRQISFLSSESIDRVRKKGFDVGFGDFAENIATFGINWREIPVGTRVKLGLSALVEITQIGKKCHSKCAIYHRQGDCIMPREGIFAKVIEGGTIRCGDRVKVVNDS
jgi:MOSC domain-containing protein YiiM